MNRVYAAAWMLVLVLDTGCPVGGEAGVLHQAMFKDMIKNLAQDSCQEEDVRAECGLEYEECLAECRKVMDQRGQR